MVGNPALALSSPSLAPTTRLPPVCPCSFIHSLSPCPLNFCELVFYARISSVSTLRTRRSVAAGSCQL